MEAGQGLGRWAVARGHPQWWSPPFPGLKRGSGISWTHACLGSMGLLPPEAGKGPSSPSSPACWLPPGTPSRCLWLLNSYPSVKAWHSGHLQ